MKLINKSKNLDEKDFIMRLQNGYILFVEYEYLKNKGTCVFREVYFSVVFDEKMKEIENFFRMR